MIFSTSGTLSIHISVVHVSYFSFFIIIKSQCLKTKSIVCFCWVILLCMPWLLKITIFHHAVDPPQSQEPGCSSECTEDESSSSDDDEVQNAFDKFIAQNNLSKPQSLSNDDNSMEAAMQEPENPQGRKKYKNFKNQTWSLCNWVVSCLIVG